MHGLEPAAPNHLHIHVYMYLHTIYLHVNACIDKTKEMEEDGSDGDAPSGLSDLELQARLLQALGPRRRRLPQPVQPGAAAAARP